MKSRLMISLIAVFCLALAVGTVAQAQAKNDYEVNLKAELEIMQLREQFADLCDSSWVELVRMQQHQIEMLERLVSEDRARRL